MRYFHIFQCGMDYIFIQFSFGYLRVVSTDSIVRHQVFNKGCLGIAIICVSTNVRFHRYSKFYFQKNTTERLRIKSLLCGASFLTRKGIALNNVTRIIHHNSG